MTHSTYTSSSFILVRIKNFEEINVSVRFKLEIDLVKLSLSSRTYGIAHKNVAKRNRMAATWDEIKRLAADFQRAQLSSTTQKLAERNCHEIVSKLVDLGLIQVIYSSDGKSYLTPKELGKEIQEEIIANGGRVNLVAIQQSINVDIHHIENQTQELVAQDDDLQMVLGQIIHVSYIEQMCRDINDQLQDQGQVTFAELTKTYDLPGDFLKKEVGSRLGTLVFGKVDPSNSDVLYTDTYINRHKARIRGIFSAITRPTPMSSVINRFKIPERLLLSLLNELIQTGRIKGSLSGNKTTYTPDIYTQAQKAWVDNFFSQNGYLEYDSLSRLGISDPKVYVKKTFKSAILLNACCVSETCLESLSVSVDECLAGGGGYVNAMANIPSVITPMDASQLVQMAVKNNRHAIVLCDTIVTTQDFINKQYAPFQSIMTEKATKDVKMNASVFSDAADKKSLLAAGDDVGSAKKDERRKKATSAQKAGGGTQGREVRSKAVKNKYKRGGAKDESDDEDTVIQSSSSSKKLEFMTPEQIAEVLEKQPELEECPAMMIEEVAARLYRPLRDKYQEVAKDIFFKTSSVTTSTGGASKRKQLGAVEEKINTLYSNIKLYEKSIDCIQDDDDLKSSLSKYLLKSLCTDVCNELVDWLAADNMITVNEGALDTVEGRAKIISNMPDDIKPVIAKVHTTLNGKSVPSFDEAVLELLSPQHMGILLKKSDKKKDRQVQFNHRQSLLEQMRNESDIPSLFHQAVVLLFGAVFQTMLHCTGKMIPQIVKQMKPHLKPENFQTITSAQELIIQYVKGEIDSSDEKLAEVMTQVKELASSLKKAEISTK